MYPAGKTSHVFSDNARGFQAEDGMPRHERELFAPACRSETGALRQIVGSSSQYSTIMTLRKNRRPSAPLRGARGESFRVVQDMTHGRLQESSHRRNQDIEHCIVPPLDTPFTTDERATAVSVTSHSRLLIAWVPIGARSNPLDHPVSTFCGQKEV